MDLHNESVQALRFPNKNNIQKSLDKVVKLAEEEREIAAQIADGAMDEDEMM